MYILKKNKRKKCPGCQGASTWQPEKGSPDIPAMRRLFLCIIPQFLSVRQHLLSGTLQFKIVS